MRWIDRIGAALVTPKRALDAADRPEAAGRAPGDLALLILLVFAGAHLDAVVRGGWLIGAGAIGDGLGVLGSRLGAALQVPLLALLAGVAVVFAAAGRKRRLGSDSDLACLTFIPAVVVALAGAMVTAIAGPIPLVDIVAGAVAMLWYAAGLAMAVAQARYTRIDDDADATEPWRFGSRRPRIAGLAVVAAAALLLGLSGARIGSDLERYRPMVSGDRAPGFSLPAIEPGGETGPEVSLSALEGKVIILDFWATWCRPCRTSMPLLEELVRARPGVELISIHIEDADKRAVARQIVDRLAPSARLVADVAAVAEAYGVSTIPHLVLVDRDGVVRYVHRGGVVRSVRDDLARRIDEL